MLLCGKTNRLCIKNNMDRMKFICEHKPRGYLTIAREKQLQINRFDTLLDLHNRITAICESMSQVYESRSPRTFLRAAMKQMSESWNIPVAEVRTLRRISKFLNRVMDLLHQMHTLRFYTENNMRTLLISKASGLNYNIVEEDGNSTVLKQFRMKKFKHKLYNLVFNRYRFEGSVTPESLSFAEDVDTGAMV